MTDWRYDGGPAQTRGLGTQLSCCVRVVVFAVTYTAMQNGLLLKGARSTTSQARPSEATLDDHLIHLPLVSVDGKSHGASAPIEGRSDGWMYIEGRSATMNSRYRWR